MNVKAIKYGRIKRQAPDPITKAQISAVIEGINERVKEPISQQPTAIDMLQKAWNARHI